MARASKPNIRNNCRKFGHKLTEYVILDWSLLKIFVSDIHWPLNYTGTKTHCVHESIASLEASLPIVGKLVYMTIS